MTDRRDPADRRDADNQGMPWWVRAIAYVGVPAAIACFLVWFLVVRVDGWQDAADDKLDAHMAATVVLAESVKGIAVALADIEREHQESGRRLERYLRQLCVSGATNRDERNQCLAVQ